MVENNISWNEARYHNHFRLWEKLTTTATTTTTVQVTGLKTSKVKERRKGKIKKRHGFPKLGLKNFSFSSFNWIILELRIGHSDVNVRRYERRVEKLNFSQHTTYEEIYNCVDTEAFRLTVSSYKIIVTKHGPSSGLKNLLKKMIGKRLEMENWRWSGKDRNGANFARISLNLDMLEQQSWKFKWKK